MDAQNLPEPKSFLKGFLQYLPILQWILMIMIGISVFALSQRDLQTTQAQELRETKQKVNALEQSVEKRNEARDKQIESFRREILTREVFDAYHNADSERMNRIEKMIEQLLKDNIDRK